MSTIYTALKELDQDLTDLACGIMDKIIHSTDEVSMAFGPIFDRAKPYNDDELQRAKKRKEFGNPPGKNKNPLGDQLNWEQILSQFTSKSKLWIISRDSDYGSFYGDRGFLNTFLYDELRKISPSAEAFLFKDIVDGIKDFAKTTGVKADALPTAAEEAEIKREIEALPPPIFGSAGTPFTGTPFISTAPTGIKASASNYWEGGRS
jgi:hypothetical protein